VEKRERPSISSAASCWVTGLPGAGNTTFPREREQLCAVLEGKHGDEDAARLELVMTRAADPHATSHDDGLCPPAGVVDELRDRMEVLA
jgi:hypothetical protein